jgi:hypothetical protein
VVCSTCLFCNCRLSELIIQGDQHTPQAVCRGYILNHCLGSEGAKTIRNQVFGDPEKNVSYLPQLVDVLEAAGHAIEIYIKTPIEVKKHLLSVVLEQKINSLKRDNKAMSKADKLTYLDKWEASNLAMLEDIGLGRKRS